jgi:hypothetical protein
MYYHLENVKISSIDKSYLKSNSHQYKTASGKIILLILIYYCLQIKVVKYYGQYLHLENQREGVCGVIVFHFQQYSWIYNYLCNQPIATKVVTSNPTHGEMYSIHIM